LLRSIIAFFSKSDLNGVISYIEKYFCKAKSADVSDHMTVGCVYVKKIIQNLMIEIFWFLLRYEFLPPDENYKNYGFTRPMIKKGNEKNTGFCF